MTSRLMHLLAKTVASSPLADDCVIVVAGVEHRTRATQVRRERLDDDGAVMLDTAIRVPAGDLPPMPVRPDEIRLGGRVLYPLHVLERGPVIEIGLTTRQGGRNARS